MWRTTGESNLTADDTRISIHFLHVEDDGGNKRPEVFFNISIHVLHVEDDGGNKRPEVFFNISIHVLHVEDDSRRYYGT